MRYLLTLALLLGACGDGASQANIRACDRVCARLTLECAAQQDNANGVLGCEAIGKMCVQKCRNDYGFRMKMAGSQ